MKGTIEQVFENESKNGQKYMTVQIGGERYSVWDHKYFDQMQQGAEIEYDFRQSGNFRNITEVRAPQQAEPTENGPTYHNGRDRQITRLSCLKSAAEIISPAQLTPDVKRDLVIDTARIFERYVAEDDLGALPQAPKGEPDAGQGR
jgi:hypothetical protein